MKKRRNYIALIQSFVLLFVALTVLSVASFAWFATESKVASFEVNVVGQKDISFWFFRWNAEDAVYEPITADGAASLSGTLIPGMEAAFRIKVLNRGSAAVLKVDFTEFTAKESDSGAANAFFSPYLAVKRGGEQRLLFESGQAERASFTLVESLALPAGGAPVLIDYSYLLLRETPAYETTIQIAATGIVFTVD